MVATHLELVKVLFHLFPVSSPELQALLMNQLTVKVKSENLLRLCEFRSSHPEASGGGFKTFCVILCQGLKKLGQSIESSYSSIQKLVISHLQRFVVSLTHLGIFDFFLSRCLFLCLLQRLWGSVVSAEWGERNVPVEAKVWVPRLGFRCYWWYQTQHMRNVYNLSLWLSILAPSSFWIL